MAKGTAARSKDNDSPIPVLPSKRPASRGSPFVVPSVTTCNPTLKANILRTVQLFFLIIRHFLGFVSWIWMPDYLSLLLLYLPAVPFLFSSYFVCTHLPSQYYCYSSIHFFLLLLMLLLIVNPRPHVTPSVPKLLLGCIF